jgi:hypothetical protein
MQRNHAQRTSQKNEYENARGALDAKRHDEYKDKNVRVLMCHACNFDSFHVKK